MPWRLIDKILYLGSILVNLQYEHSVLEKNIKFTHRVVNGTTYRVDHFSILHYSRR